MKKWITIFLIFSTLHHWSFAQNNDTTSNIDFNDFLEMDIGELLNYNVSAAVKDLSYSQKPKTENFTEEQIFKLPYSIEIINHQTIRARNLRNTIDATENSVGVISGGSPASPNGLSMRGFHGNDTKILYDGVSYGIWEYNTRPYGVSSLERIEIYKGPITLINGQSGAAGTVNYISKKPVLDSLTSDIYYSYGTYNSSILNIGVNLPIKQKLAIRLDIDENVSDGWVNNGSSELINLKTSILYKPNKRFEATLSTRLAYDQLMGYWGTPLLPNDEVKTPLNVVNTNTNSAIDNDIRFQNYNVSDHVISSKNLHTMLDITYQVSDKIRSTSKAYFYTANREWKNAENYLYDEPSDGFIRDRLSVDHQKHVYGFRSNLDINNTIAGLKNKLCFGIEFNQNKLDRDIGFLNGIQDTVSRKDPLTGNFGHVDSRFDYVDENSLALLINDQIKLSQKLSFYTGIRLERNTVERKKYNFDNTEIEPLSIKKTFFIPSYKLALSYTPIQNLNLYTHYSHQHGALTSDVRDVLFRDFQKFTPSTITQAEIGLKSHFFNQNLQVSLAAFQITRKIKIDDDNNIQSYNQQRSNGVELSSKLIISKNLTFGGSYAFNNAKLIDYYDANYGQDVTGNKPVNVPQHISSFYINYYKFLNLPFEIGLGGKHVSERQANLSNTVQLSSYTIYNSFIAYNFKQYRFAVHVRNLLNKSYIPWSDVFYLDQFILASPRTIEGTISITI